MKNFPTLFLPLMMVVSLCSMEDSRLGQRKQAIQPQQNYSSSTNLLPPLLVEDDEEKETSPENALNMVSGTIEQIWTLSKGSFTEALRLIKSSQCSEEYKECIKKALIDGLKKGHLIPIQTSDKKRSLLLPSLIKQSPLLAMLSEKSSYVVTQPMQLQCDSSSLEYLQELCAWFDKDDSNDAKNGCAVFNRGRYVFDNFVRYKAADYLGMYDVVESFRQSIAECAYAGREMPIVYNKCEVYSLGFNKEGNLLLTTQPNGVRIWEIPGGCYSDIVMENNEFPIVRAVGNNEFLTFSPSSVDLIDLTSKHVESIFNRDVYPVVDSSISSDGNFIVCLTSGVGVKIFDRANRRSRLLKLTNGRSIAIDPENSLLAVGFYEGIIKIYDIRTGKLKKQFNIYVKPVEHLIFSPNGKFLIISYSKDEVKIIKSKNGKIVKRFHTHDWIKALAVSQDGVFVAALGPDTIHVWNVNTKKCQSIRCSDVISMAFSPDSNFLAYGTRSTRNGTISFFELYKDQNHERLMKLVEYAYTAHEDGCTIDLSQNKELKKVYDGFCDEFRKFLDWYITFDVSPPSTCQKKNE